MYGNQYPEHHRQSSDEENQDPQVHWSIPNMSKSLVQSRQMMTPFDNKIMPTNLAPQLTPDVNQFATSKFH